MLFAKHSKSSRASALAMQPNNRLAFVMLALAPWLSVPARAEIVQVTSVIPAKFAEPSQLRQIVVQPFGGDGGEQLSSAIFAQLSQPDIEGKPHFIVSSGGGGGRASGIGLMSGSVSIDSSQSNFNRREKRCVEGQGFFKCKRSIDVTVSCSQRVSVITVTIRIVRASDRRVVYSMGEPFRDQVQWCEGQSPVTLAENYSAFVPKLALRVAREIAPHTETYSLRLLERTDGLDKPSAKAFKAAVKIAPRNLVDACRQWQQLSDAGQKSGALAFDLGVCAEQRKDVATASRLYDQALALSPGDKRIAEAATRARSLVVAQQTAAAQVGQRDRSESAEVAAERRVRQSEARAAAVKASVERKKVAQAAADANAARTKRRSEVATKYGSGVADSIISGTVRVGMTSAQARAAVGSACAIQRFGVGEELWNCNGKKIGFAKGRVTFVR